MNEKLLYTALILDEYEKRFAKLRCEKNLRSPWKEADRAEILQNAKEVLAFDKIPSPDIKPLDERSEFLNGIHIKHINYRSWEHCYGTFTLYCPNAEKTEKRPLVFICPGHSPHGRFGQGYQTLAFRLAALGAYVICNENIGQGSRRDMGHWKSIAPFYCGITLQGMIVKETLALIEYAKTLPFVDIKCIGAAGNSGGGTLTAFLSALEPSLAAVASCGYPSEFHYIFQKEREHCACNLLPGVVSKLEMWELYSLRAPKPLFLEQGLYDDLFPVEYFHRNARKLNTVYTAMGKSENFSHFIADSRHPWIDADIVPVSDWFAKQFSLEGRVPECRALMSPTDSVYPSDAITTDALAEQLSGIRVPKDIRLEEIFVPTYQGVPIDESELVDDLGRGSLMRVLGQLEAVLSSKQF